MSDPFIGEIRLMAFTFAPKDYAFCNGQIIDISQNPALYSLLGTTFGGNGSSTFGLPDLRGRTPVGYGVAPSFGTNYSWGLSQGERTVTLQAGQMPAHNHTMMAVTEASINPDPETTAKATAPDPGGNMLASMNATSSPMVYAMGARSTKTLSPSAIGPTGGGQPHNNMQPYLATNFCIALHGEYPSRDI